MKTEFTASLISSSRSRIRAVLACVATLLLTACGGGGGGGGNIGFSSQNQSSDPVTVEYPIAYVQRPLPAPGDDPLTSDLRDPFRFSPGGRLVVRDRAANNAPEYFVTDALFPGQEDQYDVRDLEVSPDGTKLLFALHAPEIPGADPEDQPTWNIWEYDFQTRALRRVISSNNRAELGNDVAPAYLDNGDIVFVSDRQTGVRAQLSGSGVPAFSALEESLQRKAGVLHVMGDDGRNIRQISYNQSHDLDPSLLRSGKLVFTRWDNQTGVNRMNLYTINPSGMALSMLYGFYSHDTGSDPTVPVQFANPREMEDGRLLAILRPTLSTSLGGDLIAIDIARYSDHDQPTWENIGLGGSAQRSLATNPVYTDNRLSPGGQFSAAYPLWDGTGRLLVSWSQCRALDGARIVPCSLAPAGAQPAPLLYGLWIFDPANNTQRPVVVPREGVVFTDIVTGAPRTTIATPNDPVAGNVASDFDLYGVNILGALQQENRGLLTIRSVFNIDGQLRDNAGNPTTQQFLLDQTDPASPRYRQRRGRFLQLIQAVPIPDRDDEILDIPNSAFGLNAGQRMRHIIGYVPIEPDGSVAVSLPADVPFTFNIVDANAQRISPRHNVWWQLKAGEALRCAGCHDGATERTHGRLDSQVPEVNPGATIARNGGWTFSMNHLPSMTGNAPGQTLAEIAALRSELPTPSVNVAFTDKWAADPAQRDTAFDYSYTIGSTAQVPVAPTSVECQTQWRNECRIVINYEEHIQPIWERSRPILDNDGNEVSNNRCTSCHSPVDAMGVARVPAGQLDLSAVPSDRNANYLLSYSELFTSDNEVDADGNDVLVDRPLLDDNGDPVLDDDGNPVFVQVTVPVGASMSTAGARSSPLFFGCFTAGGTCGNFSRATNNNHVGMLTPSELRLISEWLDIGAQYYNDLLDAAQP